jgi:hypothetical protein
MSATKMFTVGGADDEIAPENRADVEVVLASFLDGREALQFT